MTYDEVLAQVVDLLRQEKRVAYRVLKRRFSLDDEYLEDLKADLIDAKGLAKDEGGKVLVWVGAAPVSSSTFHVPGSQSPDAGPRTSDLGLSSLQTSDLGLRTSDFPGFWTPPHLAERIRAEHAALEARQLSDGERKTITALFADIKGSMELIEDLDPEDARQLIDPALTLMMEAVHRYEGYVVQSTGDGIFALFGAPLTHEDHAQRALYAALRMQEEIKRYADRLRLQGRQPLEIRVGVNTGEMVLRSIHKDDLHTEYTPIGHSTSLAARLQSLATGGGIVVSEPTYRLTEGYFEYRALGAAQIKGVSEPVPLYEVLGVGPLRTRLQVAASKGLARFVGRRSELEQLQRAWEHAKAGHGQIVGVLGEPGIGKSRLFHEFKLVSQQDCLVLETFSVSHGKAYAYLPLIELLKNYFQITAQDDERRRREKVGGKVLMLDRSLEDTLPYLFELLGIAEAPSAIQQMDPQMRKRRTLEAIKRLVVRESLNQPLILIFEDLHWLDTETQAFLTLLSESLATARLLLLVNYRPEYHQEWSNKTYYTQLRLDPLGNAEAEELLTTLLGDDPAFGPLKHFILTKTEGNPFFMEEIVQALVEQGVLTGLRRVGRAHRPVDLAQIHLPVTVQAVLAARIDRLPAEEKALLQTLSVIGKEFAWSLLQQVVHKPENELQALLSHLQAAEFIYEQPAFPEVEYTFKHALTQEVAYNSVLIERRKLLHEQTGQAMEALFHSRLEDYYGDLAHHYSRSRNTEKAIEYLQLAGQQAAQRSAYAEAINHLTFGLDLLKTLADTPTRTQQELALQVALGPALMATKGYGSPEVENVYARARELCRQAGEPSQLFPALRGLRLFYTVQGKLQTSRELGETLLHLAQDVHDPVLLAQGYHARGVPLFWLGELREALDYLEKGSTIRDHQPQRVFSVMSGTEAGVSCQGYASWAFWLLGYPDLALKKSEEVRVLAQHSSDPFFFANISLFPTMLSQFRGDTQAAIQERAEAVIALCREHGFPLFLIWATVLLGWALSEQGQWDEGNALMRQGLADWQMIGAEFIRPYFLALLAEASHKAGQTEKGLTLLAEALAIVERNEERMWEAEIYRLKGTLTLKQSEVRSPRSEVPSTQHLTPNTQAEAEAEACFHQAIEVARRQHAKSLELRAVTSLSRLWQQQGKKEEARRMLAEIYGWFTEGFDTKDLQEAKALLDELG
ncbi:MAG: AAA family ATPase [Deltaproteobacteria bacterium]|nr:AAA family ATPase [Deltaproteobacteria bacterium]